MPLRRPPFALVFVAAIAVGLGAVALSGRGSPAGKPPVTNGSSPTRACTSARATATSTARATIQARASASVPVSVTEHARRGGVEVAVTRSGTIVEEARVARPVAVERRMVAERSACARGVSLEAARGSALNVAYRAARKVAQAQAGAEARSEVAELVRRLTPKTLAQAQMLASAHAAQTARAARADLAREALAAASARAAADAQVPPITAR
jgi:hypothetical protein